MSSSWSLQDAKNRFSEVVNRALDSGPQIVTRHGRETAVVISFDDYRRFSRPEQSLVEFFQASPLAGLEIDLERDRDPGREVTL